MVKGALQAQSRYLVVTNKLTAIYENVVAIYDDEDSLLLLDLGSEVARILYCDLKPELLKVAENEAIKAEKLMITCEFSSFNEAFKSFLEENEYRSDKQGRILAADIADFAITEDEEYEEGPDRDGLEWVPFRDLMAYQIWELEEDFSRKNIVIQRDELLRFSSDFSGIVYDKGENIKAYDLVSEEGRNIVLEGLFDNEIFHYEAKALALKGLLKEVATPGVGENFDKVVIPDPELEDLALLRSLLSAPGSFHEAGVIYSARKKLSRKGLHTDAPETEADPRSVKRIKWLAENKLLATPFQGNINWKGALK